jgi:dCTP deaminase
MNTKIISNSKWQENIGIKKLLVLALIIFSLAACRSANTSTLAAASSQPAANAREIDPKHFDEDSLIEPPLRTAEDSSKYYLLPPHSYGLGVTVETFQMPRNVTGLAIGKSTYARVGLFLNTTPLEAGWTGRLVVELANLADLPLRVYVNEGIGQVIFLESDEDCDVSYKDRGGKYQNQKGLTYSRL